MGKASISIAISGSYNGSAVERAQKSLDRLSVRTAASGGSISRSWAEAGASAAEAGGRIHNAGRAVADAGDEMTRRVTAPLSAVGAASAKLAVDFESSMSRVAGALNDPKADMGELRQLALDMGAATVFSASESGAAMEELAKGGLSAADIKGGALRTTMDLAAAGNLALADAANVTVQAMGAFGLSAGRTGEAANALAGAAAASSADVSDLAQGLSQASAQAHSAGWTIQDTTAVLAAFADAGIKGSDAGTSLKTMLQRLAAPTDKAAAAMDQYGISARDADGRMLDAAGMAAMLSDRLGGLDSATRDAAISTIFGADASRAALVLMGQGADGIERYTAATNDQTASQRLAESQMGETQRSIEEAGGAIETAAIKIGSSLAPSVAGAAGAVGEAADAFAGLDGGTRDAVVGLGLVAAAAGPVMSVTGRVTQGVGAMATAYGRARQDVATYADALTTTNAASLKTYASNDRLAAALARNPAAKAAGGVDKYVDAVSRANAAQADYKDSARALADEVKKGSKANSEVVEGLKDEVRKRRDAMNAAKSTVTGYQQTAAAAKASSAAVVAQSAAMKAASIAAAGLKLALATIGPLIVAAGITAIASALSAAKERSDNMRDATAGLEEATRRGADASRAGAGALDGYGDSAGASKADVDGLLESQAKLAERISETNTGASAQMAQLQQARDWIGQYAGQADLSTEAQSRLRAAVQTVNEQCGTQIEVTDAANGVLSDQNGVIADVNEALSGYIDKKMEQIRVDAQQQNLTALYEQQARGIEELAKAQQALTEKSQEHDGWVEKHREQYGEYTEEVWKAQVANSEEAKAVDDAKRALESVNTSIDNVSASLGAQSAQAAGAAGGIREVATASSSVATALGATGGSIDDFAADLSRAGVSVEAFRGLSDQQLAELVGSWDGTADSIVAALDGMGAGMGDRGLSAVTALASGMGEGSVSVAAASEVVKAAASGDWSGVAAQMEAAGLKLPDSVASGISAKGFAPTEATGAMLSAVALKLAGGDVDKAAEILGGDIDAGLADGIRNGTLSEEQSAILGQDVIDRAKETLDSHSPSRKFEQIGADADAGLQIGISGGSEGPLSAVAALGQQLLGALGLTVPEYGRQGASSGSGFAAGVGSASGAVGQSAASVAARAVAGVSGTAAALSREGSGAGSGFAAGVGSGAGAASANAAALSSRASSGVSGTASALGAAGTGASSRFASGIGAGVAATSGSASRLATAAGGMKEAGDSYTWGSHLGGNFASGLGSAWSAVKGAAASLAEAAAKALGFSVPEEGYWSGSERGGERSGLHLGQNFAAGMRRAIPDVETSASALSASAALGGTAYGSPAPRPAPRQGSTGAGDRLEAILAELLQEVRWFREGIGGEIAANVPGTMSERDRKREVMSYVR